MIKSKRTAQGAVSFHGSYFHGEFTYFLNTKTVGFFHESYFHGSSRGSFYLHVSFRASFYFHGSFRGSSRHFHGSTWKSTREQLPAFGRIREIGRSNETRHVSDTWKCGSLSSIFTLPPEDLEKKRPFKLPQLPLKRVPSIFPRKCPRPQLPRKLPEASVEVAAIVAYRHRHLYGREVLQAKLPQSTICCLRPWRKYD